MQINPKYEDDLDLVDLIYQKDPIAYERLVRGDRIIKSHKEIVAAFKEVFNHGLKNNSGCRGSISYCAETPSTASAA